MRRVTHAVNVWHAPREDLQAKALTSRADLCATVCPCRWLGRLEVQAVCCWKKTSSICWGEAAVASFFPNTVNSEGIAACNEQQLMG